MDLPELFIIAMGLSMDAFAVAIGKGLSMGRITCKKAGIVGLYFGVFQAVMPLIGYYLGAYFQDKITAIDHWIAFVLLSIIGLRMILESRKKDDGDHAAGKTDASLGFKVMTTLAFATSIDALAVGVTFAFLQVDILPAIVCIGIITFILSIIGVKIGNVFGIKYKSKAELAGGVILICMGIKILVEHLWL